MTGYGENLKESPFFFTISLKSHGLEKSVGNYLNKFEFPFTQSLLEVYPMVLRIFLKLSMLCHYVAIISTGKSGPAFELNKFPLLKILIYEHKTFIDTAFHISRYCGILFGFCALATCHLPFFYSCLHFSMRIITTSRLTSCFFFFNVIFTCFVPGGRYSIFNTFCIYILPNLWGLRSSDLILCIFILYF